LQRKVAASVANVQQKIVRSNKLELYHLMELRQLNHFLAILESGSLARAAERAGVTQQALSKSLERLEESLGAALFERTPRGVLPTAFGRAIADHASAVAAEAARLHRTARAVRGAAQGRIVVGLSPIASLGEVGSLVSAFAAQHRQLRIDVTAGIDRQFSRALIAGEIDLAVAAAMEPEDSAVTGLHLADEPWCVVVGQNNPLAASAHTLADLDRARWLIGSNITLLESAIARDFAAAGLPPPEPAMTTTSVLFALNALATGDWCSILPSALIENDHRVQALPLADVRWSTPLVLMRRRSARPAGPAHLLAQTLIQRLKKPRG
jgi:LysR family transcriptional regulator, regulator of abg operon